MRIKIFITGKEEHITTTYGIINGMLSLRLSILLNTVLLSQLPLGSLYQKSDKALSTEIVESYYESKAG